MHGLRTLITTGLALPGHHPWPRAVVNAGVWKRATTLLQEERSTLLALWGERDMVHMALVDDEPPLIISLACADGRYPSVGRLHAPAIRLERAVQDLTGLVPDGLPDARPWLDHGRWRIRHPLGDVQPCEPAAPPYVFLANEGESLHQIPVGPVHAGIIEPGHFRFTASGETVVRLEERLGYTHKGTEALMAGLLPERAARLAGRVSGDSTVAYAYAFARAVEAALGIEPPPRAIWLRALMAELERLANHFGDIGAICNDAAFALLHAQFGVLRERALRVADTCFGHRLMMDCIVPGGVAGDLPPTGESVIVGLIAHVRRYFPELVELYDNTASLQDRTIGTGILCSEFARHFGAGGYVGRASGRSFDARRMPGYAPYDQLKFEVPVRQEGDVDARIWIRIREVEQSIALIEQLLHGLPGGPIRAAAVGGACEGVALVEGFRGDIFAWVRLAADGRVERCHLRDPSWFQWPLLEAVIEGNIVADFPLCNKSFNCSYSGHDL